MELPWAGAALAATIRQIHERLQRTPREFGDPLYRLRNKKMMVYRAVHPPLYLEYGIHDDRPISIVRHVAELADPIE